MQDESNTENLIKKEETSVENLRELELINQIYRYLMVASAFLVCLAHGANNVATAIAPLQVSI